MMVARAGCEAAVKLLLMSGASAWIVDANGSTALHHLAMAAGHSRDLEWVLPHLLAAGARADARDASGRTPLAAAQSALAALRRPGPPSLDGGEHGGGHGGESAPHPLLSLLSNALAQRVRMRRFRMAGIIVGRLRCWHARAAERAYAPGGCGQEEAARDWEEKVGSKRRRSGER